jgi:hypothetical protein
MPSRTEAAHLAFVGALAAKAQEAGAKLVPPERNQDLVSRLVDVGAGLAVHINVWDGDRPQPDEMLGTALGVPGGYEIRLHVRVELAVAGGASADREARFDDCRTEIIAALKPDLSAGGPVYLGGAVEHLELIDYAPPGVGLATDGLPGVKAGEFVFALSFTSDDPF